MERSLMLTLLLAAVFFNAHEVNAGGSVCTDSNPEYVECTNGLTNVMTGVRSADEVYQRMCSTSGKEAMLCFMNFMTQCPELTPQTSTGINMTAIQAEGGIDVFCEILVGECRAIQKCFQRIPDMSKFPFTNQLQEIATVTPDTAFQVLPYYIAMMCGPLKDYVQCFIGYLSSCPKTVAKLEALTNMFNEQSNQAGIVQPSLTQMSVFMESYCTLDKGLVENAGCAHDALATTGFSTCFTDTKAQIQGQRTCTSYNAMKQCVTTAVAPSCGNEAARLVSSGMPLFYSQLLPLDCEPVAHASITQMSVMTFLGAMFISLLAMDL